MSRTTFATVELSQLSSSKVEVNKTSQPTPSSEVTKLTTTDAFREMSSITSTIINTLSASDVEVTDTSIDDVVETTNSMDDVGKDKDHVDVSSNGE